MQSPAFLSKKQLLPYKNRKISTDIVAGTGFAHLLIKL